MNEAYDYIDFRNQNHSTFSKLRRIDRRDYPEEAVREALLNLLVHREYSFRSSSFISIYADRIELHCVTDFCLKENEKCENATKHITVFFAYISINDENKKRKEA